MNAKVGSDDTTGEQKQSKKKKIQEGSDRLFQKSTTQFGTYLDY